MAATGKANVLNVSVGKPKAAGAIFYALAPAAHIPTDATSELDESFHNLGYVGADGVVNGLETDSSDVKAWGGYTVISIRTSTKETFKFSLLETKKDVLSLIYGPDNVSGEDASGLTVKHSGQDLPPVAFVFEIALTGGRIKRIVVENAKIAKISDVNYKDEDAIAYEVELSALPNADGYTAVEYIALAS